MNQEIKELIDRALDEGLRGATQKRETIIRFLELDPNSEEVAYLKQAANKVAHAACENHGTISGAIGIDLCSCDMNCKFCSFGTAWGLVDEDVIYSKEQVIEMVREYVEAGATTITLRSTEFYDMNTLADWLADIRAEVPGGYLVNLNVGELTPAMAEAAYQAGATSAYHVIRMREGVDTPFSVELREETIHNIVASPLRYATCVEPLGVEHTNEEIADRILTNMSYKPYSMGCMARVNVPGTPFEGYDPISEERMLQIFATMRLSCGTRLRCATIHPPIPEALYAGANSLTVERGANPRDTDLNKDVWQGFSADEAKALLEEAGFEVSPVDPDPRFRADGNNWWKVDDERNFVMPDPVASAVGCCGPREKKVVE